MPLMTTSSVTAHPQVGLRRFTAAAAITTIAVGLLVLIGWTLNVPVLKELVPGLETMKPLTALGFMLAGLALWLLRAEGVKTYQTRLGLICAGGLAIISGLILLEYGLGVNLGIDGLLFRGAVAAEGGVYPGRPAPTTSLALLLLGLAVLAINTKSAAPLLTLPILLIAGLAVVGYLYGVSALYQIGPYSALALHAAGTFVIVALGVWTARPNTAVMAVVTSGLAGSQMARRLLPAAVAIPTVVGWLQLVGERQGLYGTEFGTALFAASTIVLLAGLIYWSAQRLNEAHRQREIVHAALQQVADEFQDLYDHAPCGYHSLDPDGAFVRINDYGLKLLGYARAEVIGRLHLSDVLTPASQALFRQSYPLFVEQGWINNLEFEMVDRAGRITSVLVSATALRDATGHYVRSRWTMLDITDRKRSEEQIEKLNTSLRQRAAALEAANRELEAFSYSVSHDLRAPLRSIDGFSLALLEDFGGHAPEARAHLARVRGAAQRMAALIDDLLNLSRVVRADMRWESVDLSAQAQAIAEELRQTQPDRVAAFQIEPGLSATGDGHLLRLALGNLLNNAWKFTGKQPAAVIEFGTIPYENGRAFFVRDNGAGFDMAYAQRLFGAFQRLHNQQDYAGTGIGLATVQRIISRHSGRVWAEGRVGAGATFYFTLADTAPPADE